MTGMLPIRRRKVSSTTVPLSASWYTKDLIPLTTLGLVVTRHASIKRSLDECEMLADPITAVFPKIITFA
jgi:hypothetical protein